MREANDFGYWCILLKDATGATDYGNYEAAVKSIKMQGGVFGNVTDSKRFIQAVDANLKCPAADSRAVLWWSSGACRAGGAVRVPPGIRALWESTRPNRLTRQVFAGRSW